jgi:hypothetical protein
LDGTPPCRRTSPHCCPSGCPAARCLLTVVSSLHSLVRSGGSLFRLGSSLVLCGPGTDTLSSHPSCCPSLTISCSISVSPPCLPLLLLHVFPCGPCSPDAVLLHLLPTSSLPCSSLVSIDVFTLVVHWCHPWLFSKPTAVLTTRHLTLVAPRVPFLSPCLSPSSARRPSCQSRISVLPLLTIV